jgi:predicted nucleic acid-binding Zn ribbon protein
VTTDDPRPLTDGLDRVLRALRGGDTRSTSTVFGRWEDIVGSDIAAHARPLKLSDGVLVVEVDEPAWATQLRFLEADLVARLADTGGLSVSRVEVRVRGARGPRRGTH